MTRTRRATPTHHAESTIKPPTSTPPPSGRPALTPDQESSRILSSCHREARHLAESFSYHFHYLAPRLADFCSTGRVSPGMLKAAVELAANRRAGVEHRDGAEWLAAYIRIRIRSEQAERIPNWPLCLAIDGPIPPDASAGRPVQALLFV